MTDLLIEAALKSSVLFGMAAVAAVGLRGSSAAVRHAVWTAAIAGALLMVPLALVLPALRVKALDRVAALAEAPHREMIAVAEPAPSDGRLPQPPVSDSNAHERPRNVEWRRLLLPVWAAGALAFSFCFLGAAIHIARISRKSAATPEPSVDRLALSVAQRLGVAAARVRLRWTDRELTPMTWGLLRPVLILPAACKTWEEERLRQVFIHEIGHIQRGDVLTQALSSAACALYWFNPLVWLAARQMLVERERACDDLVLESGARASAYAHELLEIARSLGARWTAARVSPAMARRSQISGRLLAVLDPGRNRKGLGRRVALLAAFAGAAVILPLAALGPAIPIVASAGPEAQATASAVATIGPEDYKAIAAIYEEWKAAFHRLDAEAVSLFYTADSALVQEGQAAVQGRLALRELYQQYFDLGLASAEIHPEEFYPVGDMICEVGRSEALSSAGAVLSSNRYMTLWKKEAGKWRVHRDFLSR